MLLSNLAFAASPDEKAQLFFKTLNSGQIEKAIDDIFKGSGMAEQKPQAITAMKSQVKVALGVYGEVIGLEKVREEKLTPSVTRIVYIQKFNNLPIIWEMMFYKPKKNWFLTQIRFHEQIDLFVGPKK